MKLASILLFAVAVCASAFADPTPATLPAQLPPLSSQDRETVVEVYVRAANLYRYLAAAMPEKKADYIPRAEAYEAAADLLKTWNVQPPAPAAPVIPMSAPKAQQPPPEVLAKIPAYARSSLLR